ncbi:MAG: DNA adenine methylase [Planctomycetales bacterium]|nr:DNA adenine methylase [bacterium]UNM09690.1 MAG: DNA adenine methylase [Planctomycetales bacterium]
MKVRTPCVWVGGKTRLANWILPLIDVECKTYVEPFGGSAALLLNRDPVDVEVYNDIDSALVTFMLCIKHHYHELVREISELPISRDLYRKDLRWLKDGYPGVMTDIQFAARCWYLNLNSFGGITGGGFGTGKHQNRTFRNRSKILDAAMA